MVISKSMPSIAMMKPKAITTGVLPGKATTTRGGVMPTTMTRSIHSTGLTTNQIMNLGLQLGLKPQDVKILIDHYNKTGEIPNPGNYKRIIRENKPSSGLLDIFGIKPTFKPDPEVTVTSPVIDQVVEQATNGTGVTVSSPTGFNVVDPTRTQENFFQKNKSWLIPAAAGVGILGIILLTKKKK